MLIYKTPQDEKKESCFFVILPRFVLVSPILSVFVLQNSCLLWVTQEGHLYLELSIRREIILFSSYPKFL